MGKTMVTICCITYNHENYIAEALDSFLAQIADFEFRILVHDDASTDQTAEIIRKYEKMYPDKIKAICQTENQYSKGKLIFFGIIALSDDCKYLALCEGDDYWIDPHKLQKQVDYMESHSDCTFCFTNAKIKDMSGKEEDRIFVPYEKVNGEYFNNSSRVYNVGELALLGFIPAASFLFRKSSIQKFPEFFKRRFPAGDVKLSLLLTSQGYAYFLNDITSVYRLNVPGSAMTKWKEYTPEKRLVHCQGYIDLFNLIDEYNKYKYTNELYKAKIPFELQKAMLTGNRTILRSQQFKEYIKKQSLIYRMKIYCSLCFPVAYRKLKKMFKHD
ncbi:MAG: glycosyltransferase [Clostridiaceae bacterium]